MIFKVPHPWTPASLLRPTVTIFSPSAILNYQNQISHYLWMEHTSSLDHLTNFYASFNLSLPTSFLDVPRCAEVSHIGGPTLHTSVLYPYSAWLHLLADGCLFYLNVSSSVLCGTWILFLSLLRSKQQFNKHLVHKWREQISFRVVVFL